LKKNLEFGWYCDMIECRTETGIYRIMQLDKWELFFLDISTENQSVMWFDSLLEAVQAAQDYHENIGPAS
jgi:hypothetical protein